MKRFVLVLLLIFLATSLSFAYTVKDVSRLSEKQFAEILPGKMVSTGVMAFCEESGNLFIIARDEKTRNLEWYLLDPFTKKVVKKGDCPFKAFELNAVSPDGKKVVVFGKYPMALWSLDTSSNKWKMIFKNPKGEGLAISSMSPVAFVDNLWAFTIMDLRDKEGFILDSFITYFVPEPYRLVKVASLKRLEGIALHQAFKGKVPPNMIFQVNDVVVGQKESLIYVLNSKTKDTPVKYVDYLFFYTSKGKLMQLNLIDSNEPSEESRIYPIDLVTEPLSILYRKTNEKFDQVILYTNGKKHVLMDTGKAMIGKIMDKGLVGVFTIKGQSWNLWLGNATGKLSLVKTFKKPYTAGFTKDGKRIIMINNDEVRCLSIEP